jgi:hypothetical protein
MPGGGDDLRDEVSQVFDQVAAEQDELQRVESMLQGDPDRASLLPELIKSSEPN